MNWRVDIRSSDGEHKVGAAELAEKLVSQGWQKQPDCSSLLFSQRAKIAAAVEKWCEAKGCEASAINTLTALSSMGLIYKPAAKKFIDG